MSLESDLVKLNAIPDAVIREELRVLQRRLLVEGMARKFVVPVALMEMKLEGTGPYLPTGRQP